MLLERHELHLQSRLLSAFNNITNKVNTSSKSSPTPFFVRLLEIAVLAAAFFGVFNVLMIVLTATSFFQPSVTTGAILIGTCYVLSKKSIGSSLAVLLGIALYVGSWFLESRNASIVTALLGIICWFGAVAEHLQMGMFPKRKNA